MRLLFLLFPMLIFGCSTENSSAGKQQVETGQKNSIHNKDSQQANVTVDYVTGQFDFKTHEDFVQVESQYADKEIYLHKKTYAAYKTMVDSARADGISLTLVSGTRNFDYQKAIWDRKWNNSTADADLDKALEILEYSSMPMTSRHHWGTDIDLNDLNNSYFESGQGRKEYEWLKAHASDFGFYQPYTDKSLNGRTGYNEEKWHWSYLPLAKHFLEFYNQHVSNDDITGFMGSELAKEIDMVNTYVNGISSRIKQESE